MRAARRRRLRRRWWCSVETSWLSGGFFQRQSITQAAPSYGQPRPVSRLAALQASFHIAVRLGGLVELLLFGLRAAGKRVQHPVVGVAHGVAAQIRAPTERRSPCPATALLARLFGEEVRARARARAGARARACAGRPHAGTSTHDPGARLGRPSAKGVAPPCARRSPS